MSIEAPAPRILLFGHSGSGKSSLLGALARAGETQGDILGAEIVDLTGRLPLIRDHIYSGAEFHNTHTELVTYEIRLRPWRVGPPARVFVLIDCDGNAAHALMRHPDSLTERFVRGNVASAVVQSDLIALVVKAGADDRELDEAFDEFLMFIERVHGRKAFEREVGGFPIFLVLTQCDRLAKGTESRDAWESEVHARLDHALRRFKEFLDEQQPLGEVDSPYLPFGSVNLRGFATGVRSPFGEEPFGVAEFFHEAFASAEWHRELVRRSQKRLRRTLWSVAVGIWMLFAGAIAISIYQPKPADPGLAERVQSFFDRDPRAAVRLAEKNIARNRRQLAAFQNDPGFFALPENLRAFVNGRVHEIDEYQAYVAKLNAAPAPAEARSLEELAHTESLLNSELALPAHYTWGETEAAQLRDKWLADVSLIRSAESAWHEWYRGLANQALALSLTRSFEGDWRDRVAAVGAASRQPRFDVGAPIPGSQTVPRPRGEALTYHIPAEFDRVYQASRDWEFTRTRLDELRQTADALGLTSQTDRRVLDLPPPGPGIDSAALPTERLKQLAGVEWPGLAAFPEPGRSLLAARLHESFGNGVKHARKLLAERLTGDTPEAYRKLGQSLLEPSIRDWGRLLLILLRIEKPDAVDPAIELADFLRAKDFAIDAKGFDLTIPLALRVSAVAPTSTLNITITPPTGPPLVSNFKLAGEGTSQGLNTVYRFVSEQSEPLIYRPGDALKIELPVRSGEQRFVLIWREGATRTFAFDRWLREPRLVPASGSDEPAIGVMLSLVYASKWPPLPVLLPEVKR